MLDWSVGRVVLSDGEVELERGRGARMVARPLALTGWRRFRRSHGVFCARRAGAPAGGAEPLDAHRRGVLLGRLVRRLSCRDRACPRCSLRREAAFMRTLHRLMGTERYLTLTPARAVCRCAVGVREAGALTRQQLCCGMFFCSACAGRLGSHDAR